MSRIEKEKFLLMSKLALHHRNMLPDLMETI